MIVGDLGLGRLNISNGSSVHSNQLAAPGRSTGSIGLVTVDGTGTLWSNSQDIEVGGLGTGDLEITNGGQINCRAAYVGNARAPNNGTVRIDGSGSAWTNTNDLGNGQFGVGTLLISNGGHASNEGGFVGSGTVTIDGVGSTWSNSGQLMVGDSFNFTGDATVLISNGGTLTCNNCHTQGSFGHPSTVTVDGVGSVWNTNFLTIGEGAAVAP